MPILKKSYLYICVENSISENFDEKKALQLHTSKTDSKKHGYGTKIISKIAKKYKGYVSYCVKENKFTVEVLLQIKEKEEII